MYGFYFIHNSASEQKKLHLLAPFHKLEVHQDVWLLDLKSTRILNSIQDGCKIDAILGLIMPYNLGIIILTTCSVDLDIRTIR